MTHTKIALVTGGSSGIGLAVTRNLLQQSYHVIVVARNRDKFSKLGLPSSCEFMQADVADWSAMSQVFKKAYDQYGHIDVVVANAGILEESPHFWENGKGPDPVKPNTSCVQTNLIGVIHTVSLGLHYMRRQGVGKSKIRGKFILTASAVAIHGEVTEPIYAAAPVLH
jgi:15-hydroxyprostaglandin dehydrogenase (NAD)